MPINQDFEVIHYDKSPTIIKTPDGKETVIDYFTSLKVSDKDKGVFIGFICPELRTETIMIMSREEILDLAEKIRSGIED